MATGGCSPARIPSRPPGGSSTRCSATWSRCTHMPGAAGGPRRPTGCYPAGTPGTTPPADPPRCHEGCRPPAMSCEHALPRSLARLSGRQTPVVAIVFVAALTLTLGLPLTYAYGGASTAGYLLATGALAVVLVYLSRNIAVSVLRA